MALGEGECLAHESGASLSQGEPDALDVCGASGVLTDGPVPGSGNGGPVRGQEVGVHGDPGPVPARERAPQARRGCRGAVPGNHCQHPPGARVQGYPHPLHLTLGPYEAPQLVRLDYDRADFLGAAPGSCGVSSRHNWLTKF